MKKQTYKDFIRDISNKATKFTLSIWYFIVNNICELYTTFFNNLSHILVIKKQCFCPSDCESTKYIFETSFSPRRPDDTALLIKEKQADVQCNERNSKPGQFVYLIQ